MSDAIENLRHQLGEAFQAISSGAKNTYQSSYYRPESLGSPWEATKLAEEIAFSILTSVAAETVEEFLKELVTRLEERRAALLENDIADPDGYGCAALRELISEVHHIGKQFQV